MKSLHLSPALILFLLFSHINCEGQTKHKINGVSFVAPPKEIGKTEIILPKNIINANYLSIMPYAFIPEGSTDLKFNSKWQWWGEKEDGTIETIKMAHSAGYKVMLKPHVWKMHGEYTGKHSYSKGADWEAFEASFSRYILRFAKIADSMNVALFCIGTEWEQFVIRRPNFWNKLIKEIRKVYHGQLTYAANWDEYKKVSFWSQLDFIGIDAYFPLSEEKTPNVNALTPALKTVKDDLNEFSTANKRPILFTEFGYRSRDYTTMKPWESDIGGQVNLTAQHNAYTAFFKNFWEEDFIAGGFIWKWFPDHINSGGINNNQFTPQNKPVEKAIKKAFSSEKTP